MEQLSYSTPLYLLILLAPSTIIFHYFIISFDKMLLLRLLDFNPVTRITAEEALQHPYIQPMLLRSVKTIKRIMAWKIVATLHSIA